MLICGVQIFQLSVENMGNFSFSFGENMET